jgi:acyl dehydratase
VELALAVLDLPDADAGTIAQLQAYAAADEDGNPQPVVVDEDFVDLKLRGLLALVLSSPEWQMA